MGSSNDAAMAMFLVPETRAAPRKSSWMKTFALGLIDHNTKFALFEYPLSLFGCTEGGVPGRKRGDVSDYFRQHRSTRFQQSTFPDF
jgi:hypothetical protein